MQKRLMTMDKEFTALDSPESPPSSPVKAGAAEAMEAIYQAMKTVNRRRKAHGDSQVLFLIQMSD